MRACSGPMWTAALQLVAFGGVDLDRQRAFARDGQRVAPWELGRHGALMPPRDALIALGKVDRCPTFTSHAAARSRPSRSIGRRGSTRSTSRPRRTSGAPGCSAPATTGVRVVVLRGLPGMFCSGADLKFIRDGGDGGDTGYLAPGATRGGYGERFKQILEYIHSTISEIRRAPKPFIAAVDGVAAAGGFGIAMSCDLVLASTRASFEWAYTKTGLTGAESSTFLLPRLIGLRRVDGADAAEPAAGGDAGARVRADHRRVRRRSVRRRGRRSRRHSWRPDRRGRSRSRRNC